MSKAQEFLDQNPQIAASGAREIHYRTLRKDDQHGREDEEPVSLDNLVKKSKRKQKPKAPEIMPMDDISAHEDPIVLSVTIMTHPNRRELLQETVKSLGSLSSKVQVVTDDASEGIWANAKRAWRKRDEKANWHMVLQDDIDPHPQFLETVPMLLNIVRDCQGDMPVSFCANIPDATNVALNQDKHWVKTDWVNHAQAIAMPVWMIERWIHWADAKINPAWRHSDLRLELFLMAHNRMMMTTVPNIIAHKDQGSVDGFLRKHPGSPPLDKKIPIISLDWTLGADDPVVYTRKVWDRYRMNAFSGL